MEKIYVIGVGMAPWNVPEQVKPLIYGSDLLVGGRRLLGYFKDYSGNTAVIESFEQASEMKFSGLNFVLLKRIKPPEIPLSIGIDDESYVHERGMITKKEIRAVGLAELRIRPSDTVWDLGAGCGSVAIEASYLARDGKVFAVEKNRTRVEYIKENIRRTGAYLVEVVEGKMPHCLELGWPFKIIEVNVARSSEVSGNIRLEALNPVFIIRAEKTN